jgi:hypothetical protein
VTAVTDGLAELGSLELEAAASTEWRGNLSSHEQRPHEAGPKGHVGEEKLAAHASAYRRRGRPGLGHDHELGDAIRRVE